jgi:hypothetical protein
MYFMFFSPIKAANYLISKDTWFLKQAAQLLLLVKSSHSSLNRPNMVIVMLETNNINMFEICSKFGI